MQTASDVYLKRICSLDTSAFSELEVFDDNCAIESIYLLSCLLTNHRHCHYGHLPVNKGAAAIVQNFAPNAGQF